MRRLAPDTAQDGFKTFLDELDEAGATEPAVGGDWLTILLNSNDEGRKLRGYNIQHAADAREKIRYRRNADSHGVSIWNGDSADNHDSGVVVEMEKDFTTAGTPGRLRCPFRNPISRAASTNGQRGPSTPRSSRASFAGRRSKRPSFHDPIRAEICGNDPGSTPPSVDGSAPLCPIRFLDQHRPEDVAAYFQKHKHELPRSHEICVRRYQSNELQIRQLDEKYGNLVSMVQGLGLKHQPMLPEKADDEEAVIDEPLPSYKIKNWAKTVSHAAADDGASDCAVQDEEREPRFDRTLKEVRLGESPSRPWGIQVPKRYHKAGSAVSAKSDPTASPLDPPALPQPSFEATKCPIDHKKMKAFDSTPPEQLRSPEPTKNYTPQPAFLQTPQQSVPKGNASQQASMVFTGPVFIGYSMEQALQLLHQSGRV